MRWRCPPGELVRVPVHVVGRETDDLEQLAHPRARLLARQPAVDLERVAEDLPDALARVQRRVRVLEDHLHLAPVRAQPPPRQRRDVAAAEVHRARRRLVQPHEQTAERRLAAAGLADDAERLAAPNLERDAVDRVDDVAAAAERRAAHGEVLDEVACLDERLRHALLRSRRSAARSAGSRWHASAWSASTFAVSTGRSSHFGKR